MMSSTSTPDLASVNNSTAARGMGQSYSSHSHSSAHIGGSSPDLVSRRNLANSAKNLNGYSQNELSNNYNLNSSGKDQEEPIYQNQRELMQQIIMHQVCYMFHPLLCAFHTGVIYSG